MPNYEGNEPYVDPGTEPEDHTGAEEIEEPEEVEEVDPEVPQPGDADYVDPEEEPEPVEPPAEAQEALAFYKHVQTKDGAVDFLIEAGLGLGKSIDELEAFFSGAPQEPVEEEDDSELDRVMTFREFQEQQAKLEGKLSEREQLAKQQAQAEKVRATAVETVEGLRIGEEELTEKQRTVVLNFADTYLDENSQWDPAAVKEAIGKGFKDFTDAMGFTTEGKKVVKRKVVPKGLKGSTGGATEEGEPTNLKDAFARARKQYKAAGVID